MDVTKGRIGRRVCGVIEVTIGALIAIGAIYNVANGYSIISFLIAGFMIMTGSLGTSGKTSNMIIAYMVTGIICSLYFGYATVSSIIVVIAYNNLLTAEFESDDDPNLTPILIGAVVIVALGFIVSASGVIFAALPWCGKSEDEYEA